MNIPASARNCLMNLTGVELNTLTNALLVASEYNHPGFSGSDAPLKLSGESKDAAYEMFLQITGRAG